MNRATRQFLNLILEEEDKEQNKKETAGEKGKRQRSEREEKQQAEQKQAMVFDVQTDNKLSQGRPISDPGLANMKYRSNGEPAEAKAMLDELGIKSGGGSNWYESLTAIMSQAASGEMSVLIQGSSIVKSKKNVAGVKINLAPLWKQDDKDGKRSFGFIRAIIAASNKSGYFASNATTVKNLRVEEAVGENAFVVYVSRKAKSWGAQ